MSREIKFRVWHKRRKKYYEVHHLHCGTIGIHSGDWATCKAKDCIENKDIYIQVQPSDCILEQYTGLKDKKGKEIYEGDIVYLAGYGAYECEFPFIDLYERVYSGDFNGDIGEIISNIHEDSQ